MCGARDGAAHRRQLLSGRWRRTRDRCLLICSLIDAPPSLRRGGDVGGTLIDLAYRLDLVPGHAKEAAGRHWPLVAAAAVDLDQNAIADADEEGLRSDAIQRLFLRRLQSSVAAAVLRDIAVEQGDPEDMAARRGGVGELEVADARRLTAAVDVGGCDAGEVD